MNNCSGGRVRCDNCVNGYLICSSCKGKGETHCISCLGSSKQIIFNSTTIKYDNNELECGYQPSGFSKLFPNFRIENSKDGKVIFDANSQEIDSKSTLALRANEDLNSKLKLSSDLDLDLGAKIVFQKLMQIQHPIYEVQYEFEDQEYLLLYNEFNNQIYAEIVPRLFNKKKLQQRIKDLFNKKNFFVYSFLAVVLLTIAAGYLIHIRKTLSNESSIVNENICQDFEIEITKNTYFYSRPNIKSQKLTPISSGTILKASCDADWDYFYEIRYKDENSQTYISKYVFVDHSKRISE